MLKEKLNKLLEHEDLTQPEATALMDSIMGGEVPPAMIAGILVALRAKGEIAAEVAGFVESMRQHSVQLEIKDANAVDGVGTGGDGSHSFNISTAAALVAAAAGVTVAKHGNRSVSSKCGSADLLEAAGGRVDCAPEKVKKAIDEIGFGFMYAPTFHPAMKYAAPPRKELGVRTVFNILGPMTNPAGVKRILLGVYDRALFEVVAEVLSMTGCEHAVIVHSQDGLDELSISAPTDYLEIKGGRPTVGTITPRKVGLETYPPNAVAGGEAADNLRILQDILKGQSGAYRDVVLFNAGALIYVGGKAETTAEGVKLAAAAVDSGKAADLLTQWVASTTG